MTRSGKTGLISTITDIHFLSVRESCTHALPMQKHQVLDHRWPGLLLQMALYRCCQALEGFNTRYKTAPDGSIGLPCGLYQFFSHTEGAALLFESEKFYRIDLKAGYVIKRSTSLIARGLQSRDGNKYPGFY